MAIAGPWFITPHAVQRYRERVRNVSAEEALGALVDIAARAHFVRDLTPAIELWRGPGPLRLRLRVARAAEGRAAQLVTVLPGCDAARFRRDGAG